MSFFSSPAIHRTWLAAAYLVRGLLGLQGVVFVDVQVGEGDSEDDLTFVVPRIQRVIAKVSMW